MTARHLRLAGHTRVFALDDGAHAELLDYLGRARATLGAGPDAEETVRDLEASIGEQLAPLGGSADAVVTVEDVLAVLERTGPIEADPSDLATGSLRRGPFWARVVEGRWLGGVCLGVAARGGFSPAWVRAITVTTVVVLSMLLATVGDGMALFVPPVAATLLYLALLLLLPPVRTVDEYRRLSGGPARVEGSPRASVTR